MCCHVHQPWTWLFISYRDWFNTAVTPWGFWKAQWDLWDSASLLDTLRDALCVQISLLGLRPSHQAKRNLWSLQSNSVPEQKCWLRKVSVRSTERNRPGVTPFLQQCTAETTSAERAQGGALGTDAEHIPHAQQNSHFTFTSSTSTLEKRG